MPVVLLERVPLPNLTTYTSVSVLLLALVILHGHHTVYTQDSSNDLSKLLPEGVDLDNVYQTDHESDGYLVDLCAAMLQETWSIWILVNTAYCCLLLFGKLIQKMIFGELRVVEQQQLKDKFWNFVFYKFIFVFGVMNVQTMEEVALWCAWFSLLGFLHLLAQLCKDRFQYLCSSPATPMSTHAKVLLLLLGIEVACVCLLSICIIVGLLFSGMNTFAFMAAECILLVIKSFHVIVRYFIHLWDSAHEGIWENRALYVYYSELIFELCALAVDFVHHLHMLLWGNIFLSMASLVIFMQLRFLFYEFQRRYKRHKNYLRVVSSMESRFPMAPKERLEECNENCAICWEKLESARTLPCGHLFHNSCLRSWLEQDTTCPTCRKSLADPNERQHVNANPGPAGDMPSPMPSPNQNPQQLYNHFFHFDGSRYVSWLPSFSVEVTHTTLLGERNTTPVAQNSQMDNMVRQVREVFPDVPSAAVLEDLQRTRSVQLTLENIIEGSIGVPQPLQRNGSSVGSGDGSLSALHNIHSDFNESSLHDRSVDQQETIIGVPHRNDQSFAVLDTDLYSSESLQYNPELHEDQDARVYVQQQNSHSQNNEYLGRNFAVNDEVNLNSIYDDNLPIPYLMGEDTEEANYIAETDNETSDGTIYHSGYRFSKSSSERASMLQERKQSLLDHARRHYLTSHDQENYAVESTKNSGLQQVKDNVQYEQIDTNSSTSSELQRRRDLAYEAARRRFQQS